MRTLLVLGVLAAITSALHAQQPPAPSPRVDVASVKPSNPDATSMHYRGFLPSGLFSAVNMSLGFLIRHAYLVPSQFQLVGAPEWVESAQFDISARTDPRPSPEQQRKLLQALLADRFKLSVHTETRQLPIYALVMATSDGRLGPQLRRSPPDRVCTASPGDCRMRFSAGRHTVEMENGRIQYLIVNLPSLDRLVVDHTGLSGKFDWELAWESDPTATTTGPSIFSALQEQLGLKLESTQASVEVLVIDHVEQPTPD